MTKDVCITVKEARSYLKKNSYNNDLDKFNKIMKSFGKKAGDRIFLKGRFLPDGDLEISHIEASGGMCSAFTGFVSLLEEESEKAYYLRFEHEYYQSHKEQRRKKLCWSGPFETRPQAKKALEKHNQETYVLEPAESCRPSVRVVYTTRYSGKYKREEFSANFY